MELPSAMASLIRDSGTKVPEDPAAMAPIMDVAIRCAFEFDLVAASEDRAPSRADECFKINGAVKLLQQPDLVLLERYSYPLKPPPSTQRALHRAEPGVIDTAIEQGNTRRVGEHPSCLAVLHNRVRIHVTNEHGRGRLAA
jgi:hypothetical protein